MSLGSWLARNGNRAKDALKGAGNLALENPVKTSAALGAIGGGAMHDDDQSVLGGAAEGALMSGGVASLHRDAEVLALLKKLGLG